MKLVIVSTEMAPGPGGIGMHAHQLATAATRAGATVTVVAPQDYVSHAETEAFNRAVPYAVERVDRAGSPLRRSARRFALVARVLRRVSPDIVLASGER
ncbi:MAG: glycosyltransferase, partial [Actinomycetota bacterium]